MNQQQFEQLIKVLEAAKWTEIATLLLLVLSFVIGVGSLLYARRQLIADHRRSQRQIAMEMCSRWSDFTSPETASVTRLMERMLPNQCEAIASLTILSVDAEHKHHLINILELRFPNFEETLETLKKGKMYEIEGKYLLVIRHIAIRYLNMLESILVSWSSGIADQEIIEKEFAYLFDEKKDRTAMETFRKKLGTETFPAIELFMTALRDRIKSGSSAIRRPPAL